MGFVFDLENWVYSNSDYINDYFKNESNFINNLNNNILKSLSINKKQNKRTKNMENILS